MWSNPATATIGSSRGPSVPARITATAPMTARKMASNTASTAAGLKVRQAIDRRTGAATTDVARTTGMTGWVGWITGSPAYGSLVTAGGVPLGRADPNAGDEASAGP